MKRRVANCPACGGHVEFRLSTALVTICEYCHSVVARTDTNLEDHGKVAELVETDSPISRGMTGQFEQKSFEVVGRVQYQHAAGGVWNEWYLRFANDRVRWLAEAQSKFYLTEEKRLPDEFQFPDFPSIQPGQPVTLPDRSVMVVAETGVAVARSADGDIPWDFRPNTETTYVDLNGTQGRFATIDYGNDGPILYAGREVSAAELGLPKKQAETAYVTTANTGAVQLKCIRCGGPLTLNVPDQAQRICCPNCHAMLDCEGGSLKYLKTLKSQSGIPQVIPLGAVGRLNDIDYVVIGFMERFVVSEGTKYSWVEYLLYNNGSGFRWLVCSKGHWSLVESVPVADVKFLAKNALFNDSEFALFDRGTAIVSYVVGEFYWRVAVGEKVLTTDYIAPPFMLTSEQSATEKSSELNFSLGVYLPKEALEKAFKLPELPSAWGVGAIQPARIQGPSHIVWLSFAWTLVVLDIFFTSGSVTKPFSQFHFFAALSAVSAWPLIAIFLRRQFEVQRWQESDFSPYE